jgi:hypothetical protein
VSSYARTPDSTCPEKSSASESRRRIPASWAIATTKIPAYVTLNPAASIERPLLTGSKTVNNAQATTTSRAATTSRLAMAKTEHRLRARDIRRSLSGVVLHD